MALDPIFVALECKIRPGAFSGERLFKVVLANSEIYTSIAPREFFWNNQKALIDKNEPNSEIDGKIAARLINKLNDNEFIVEIPDGEIIAVNSGIVENRPTRIKLNAVEQEPYVLV